MNNIYLLTQYNNYYNRIVKKEDALQDYMSYVYASFSNINFIPNDGITAEQIINLGNISVDLSSSGIEPDYFLVTDEYSNIVSRWFIMSTRRERGGQYRLSLKRDVLADYQDAVLKSTAYIKRAIIPISNPLIFNSEGMQFNQIKTSETLLYDRTQKPWIVGYVANNVSENLKGASIDLESPTSFLTNYEELSRATQTLHKIYWDTDIEVRVKDTQNVSNRYYVDYHVRPAANPYVAYYNYKKASGNNNNFNFNTDSAKENVARGFSDVVKNKENELKNIVLEYNRNNIENDDLLQYDGQIVWDSNEDRYYKVSVVQEGPGETVYENTVQRAGTNFWTITPYYRAVTTLLKANPYISFNELDGFQYDDDENYVYLSITYLTYRVKLDLISYGDYAVEFSQGGTQTERSLDDAPYKMFCMPYNLENYKLAIQLGINNGSKIYDIQLLPYCPVQDYYYGDGTLKPLTNLTLGKDYTNITKGQNSTEVLGYLFWAKNSVFTFNLDVLLSPGDLKISNECDMHRLVSPNGNGTFEFSIAKNMGVARFNVDCTYRPFDPYIHLNPLFDGLYGENFRDFRGLVLNGDFSIPAINDQWIEYTIQNKNYQNIFNREVQSMQLQHKYARIGDIVGASVGTLQTAGTGAAGGMMVGGGIGAAIGGAAGGIASAVGGAFDIAINERLRKEQLALKKDMYSYQLQNIQALPQSVSKTGCLTNNNKLVPYIEYYTCTDEEKEVLRNKIKYEGMTVGAVGTIGDYVQIGFGEEDAQPIECDLIKIDNSFNEDYHVAMEIANELSRGVRIA